MVGDVVAIEDSTLTGPYWEIVEEWHDGSSFVRHMGTGAHRTVYRHADGKYYLVPPQDADNNI